MSLNYKYTCVVHEGALSFQNILQLLIFCTCTFWIVEIATLSQRRNNIRHARKILIVSEILWSLSMAIGTFFRRFFLSHGLIQRLFIFIPVWGVGGKTPGIGETFSHNWIQDIDCLEVEFFSSGSCMLWLNTWSEIHWNTTKITTRQPKNKSGGCLSYNLTIIKFCIEFYYLIVNLLFNQMSDIDIVWDTAKVLFNDRFPGC